MRNLERRLSEIARKSAREVYESEVKCVKVTGQNVEKYLGKERYTFDQKNENDEVGIVRGLAWTSVGGDTLEIEVNVMPGKGEVQLTGQLGDVMKESAQAGLSYIRSVGEEYHIPKKFFQENDIHIHIPEGAVPKDGPSAGITMATAMLSAITQTPVRADVAMTGEITLRGRVLPIGGLKEKILAAKNAGIKTICIPKKNEKDVEEISAEIKKGLELVFVEKMQEVLEVAFVKGEKHGNKKCKPGNCLRCDQQGAGYRICGGGFCRKIKRWKIISDQCADEPQSTGTYFRTAWKNADHQLLQYQRCHVPCRSSGIRLCKSIRGS